jgi:hypothetical protein
MGRMLGNVASGLGMRQFASQLGLGKQAEKIIQANEAGQLGKKDLSKLGLTASDLKGYDLDNGRLRSFDAIDLILKKRGLGEDAAEDKRKTLDFQIASIKATLSDAFSDVGSAVYEGINGPLAKGVTLADKFKEYMASPDGKKTVHDIAESFGKIARFIGDIIVAIPRMIGYLNTAYEKIKPLIELNMSIARFFDAKGSSTASANAALKVHDASTSATSAVGGTHGAGVVRSAAVQIGNIIVGHGVGTPSEIVERLMPEMKRQMIDHITRGSAGGAAPNSAP